MLLKIVDLIDSDPDNRHIQISFESDKENISFTSEYLSSPFTRNFSKTLSWYFNAYLNETPWETGDKDVVNKLISLGNQMGDKLLGEDHELMKVSDIIKETGIDQLLVQIKSSRLDFFLEQWEALILPESPYILSTVCKGFERFFNAPDPAGNTELEAEKHYELDKTSPLKILHVNAHWPNGSTTQGQTFATAVELQQYEGAIDCEIWSLRDWEALAARILDRDNPIHILHYNGPLSEVAGEPGIVMEDVSIPFSELAAHLNRVDIPLLVVEATANTGSLTPVDEAPLEQTLAKLSSASLQRGVCAVIGLSQVTDPHTSKTCLNEVYHCIAKGMTVTQAVVEARKSLQRHSQSELFHAAPVPFQCWSLLRYYSRGGELHLFTAPQPRTELQESQRYAETRKRLYGFHADYLPPNLDSGGDGIFPELLTLMPPITSAGEHPIAITGPSGSGKTRLLHRLGWHLIGQRFQYGFYFNYSDTHYTKADILEMIGPVIARADNDDSDKNLQDQPPQTTPAETPKPEHTLKNLENLPSFFALDNFPSSDRDSPDTDELLQFLKILASGGHVVVLAAKDSGPNLNSPGNNADIQPLAIPPLPLQELQVLGAETLRKFKITEADQSESYRELLTFFGGNPLLAQNLLPALSRESADKLLPQLQDFFTVEAKEDPIETAYTWQWQQLPRIWKRWLIALSEHPGTLLEMISMVCDAPERSGPALRLFELFEGEKTDKFADAITAFEIAGFVQSNPHGRILNPRSLSFIQRIRQSDNPLADDLFTEQGQTISLQVSLLICESLRRLLVHIDNSPNPTISQHLLLNRRTWAQQLEQLWSNGEHRAFLETLNHLSAFLQQNQLAPELSAWCLELLLRSPALDAIQDNQVAYMVAWLRLASSALSTPEAGQQPLFSQAADLWRNWLEQQIPGSAEQPNPCLHNCCKYLQQYYRIQQDWAALRRVCTTALNEYTAFEIWPAVVQELFSLAESSFKLNENDTGIGYEQQILDQLPFDQLPQGYKSQLMIRLISNRISRTATVLAQELLDQLRAEPEAEKLASLTDMLQADIYFQSERVEAAAELYEKILSEEKNTNPEHKQYLESQLSKCKKALDS